MNHVTFETDVLSLEHDGFYCCYRNWVRWDEQFNYACRDRLNKYFVMPRKLGSRIVIVFTTRETSGCPSVDTHRLYAAGRVARYEHEAELEDFYCLWWWVEIVEDV